MQERRAWPEHRIAELTAEIAARLRKPCAHLSDDDFAALVRKVAISNLRFRELERQDGRRPTPTPRRTIPPGTGGGAG